MDTTNVGQTYTYFGFLLRNLDPGTGAISLRVRRKLQQAIISGRDDLGDVVDLEMGLYRVALNECPDRSFLVLLESPYSLDCLFVQEERLLPPDFPSSERPTIQEEDDDGEGVVGEYDDSDEEYDDDGSDP